MTSRDDVTLCRDAWGRLVLTDAGGRQHVGVELIRAFPLTDPEHLISLCDVDGRELLQVDLEEVSPALRQQLAEELARREFVPVIRRLVRVSAMVEPCEWEVETDRGPTRFVLNSEDDIHRLDEHRALVTDAQGTRYLIPDTRSLDGVSRRLLERYL